MSTINNCEKCSKEAVREFEIFVPSWYRCCSTKPFYFCSEECSKECNEKHPKCTKCGVRIRGLNLYLFVL